MGLPDTVILAGASLFGAIVGAVVTWLAFGRQAAAESRDRRLERHYEALMKASGLLRVLLFQASELSLARSWWAWIRNPRRHYFVNWRPLAATMFELSPVLSVLSDDLDRDQLKRLQAALDRMLEARSRDRRGLEELRVSAVAIRTEVESRARTLVSLREPRRWYQFWRRP